MKPAKSRKVLFLDHTAHLSGGEIALLHLVQELDRAQWEPVVVLFTDGPLRPKLEAANVETHLLPLDAAVAGARKDELGRRILTRLNTAAKTLLFCLRLARFIEEQRPALVHCNSLKADILGGVAGRLAFTPVLWHVRDRIDDDYLPPKVAQAFRWLCRWLPHMVVANSAATLSTLQLPESKARVVHDGTMVPEVLPEAKNVVPLVGIVGRITRWKGQHIFIEAAVMVHERFPTARFQIIGAALFGEEDYEREVKALAATHGLDGALEWTGFRSDVPDLMAKLDVVVHASTTGEPFGQVVIEGMAASKPVVATNGGGVPEIVRDGETGLLVPMSDAEAMAEAIIELLSDPQRAQIMGDAGRRHVEKYFTVARTARGIEAVYEAMLDDHDA